MPAFFSMKNNDGFGRKNRAQRKSGVRSDCPKDNWTGPQWNAYCEAGDTHDERRRRLHSAPLSMQPDILRHLKTVHAIRKFYESRGKGTP